MKFKELEKLINNILENEYTHVLDEDIYNMQNSDRYQALRTTIDTLRDFIGENLSEEQKDALVTFEDTLYEIGEMENQFYFNKGVRAGLSNLNFLNDINAEVII